MFDLVDWGLKEDSSDFFLLVVHSKSNFGLVPFPSKLDSLDFTNFALGASETFETSSLNLKVEPEFNYDENLMSPFKLFAISLQIFRPRPWLYRFIF